MGYFKVISERAQNRVLFWGIVGAIVLRGIMVLAGAAAIHEYRPLLLVCAVVLIYSTYQVFFLEEDDDDEEDLTNNGVVVFAKKILGDFIQGEYQGSKFINDNGKGTPLLLVLFVIELSDVVFAVDSVPAIFGITEDGYVVWSACMCAILCLRSLYTLIVQFVADLEYMNKAIGLVLFFIAVKLILDLCFEYHISIKLFLSSLVSSSLVQFSPSSRKPRMRQLRPRRRPQLSPNYSTFIQERTRTETFAAAPHNKDSANYRNSAAGGQHEEVRHANNDESAFDAVRQFGEGIVHYMMLEENNNSAILAPISRILHRR